MRIEAPGGAAVPPRCTMDWAAAHSRQHRRWAASWSPEQIANRLRVTSPMMSPCEYHTSLYQALYVQGRGALRRELTACLRTGRALRVAISNPRTRQGVRSTRDHDSERPAEADDRVPGHWEGASLGWAAPRSGLADLALHDAAPPSPSRRAQGTALPSPATVPKRSETQSSSITTLPEPPQVSDLGPGGGDGSARQIRIDTGMAIYFCDPQSPWQRGTNENTNGLLRQYFPKGTDLSQNTPDDLAAVACAQQPPPVHLPSRNRT